MIAAWVLFPALLLVLSIGCGLLVERFIDRPLPGALIPITGMALIVVCGQFLTLASATAELTAPVVVALAIIGIGLGWREAVERFDPWPAGVAFASFAIFAAPIVLSGDATFAGYIKLDDTATWMTLTDRVMESGRSLDGLAPSTYEATLEFNLGDGYPIGVFIPLGVATLLSGQDVAWTVQPYMATLGALLALGLWEIARPLVASRELRALAAVVGSVSALLFGYYLWGGIKEVASAALIAAAVPLAWYAVAARGEVRALVPLTLVCAAEIGVLSAGGVVWLALPLAGALALLVVSVGSQAAARSAAWCAGLVVVLSLPVLATGGLLPPTSSPLTSGDAKGNLIEPLDPAQVAGIWPTGDFRLAADEAGPTYFLIAVAAVAAVGAAAYAWRRRSWMLPLYLGGALFACLLLYALGSPWVDGKALATASPAIPFAAVLGGAALYASGRRAEGALLLVAIVGGVLWSNVLQYRDVNLAPRDQLAELEEIGEEIEGEGPALMTEYQPYGARHFLREADPEAASELRRRLVPLLEGGSLAKGEYADTDRFQLGGLLEYRTLVLRRGPGQSRPPSPFELVRRGEYYEVWQAPDTPVSPGLQHLGLGDEVNPVGEPDCGEVRRLAEVAGEGGAVLAASRALVVSVGLSQTDHPPEWSAAGAEEHPIPTGPGEIVAQIEVARPAEYEIWLGGSMRPEVDVLVDGESAGSVRRQLNNAGLYSLLGAAHLAPGEHEIIVRFGDSDLHPGSGGTARAIGPLALSDSDAAEARVIEIPPDEAEQQLCGRSWDWIEALPGLD